MNRRGETRSEARAGGRRGRGVWARMAGMVGAWVAAHTGLAADAGGYARANPVPAAPLREMTTDRPDVTESPFTVDAGHAQLEMDFANYASNRGDGGRTEAWSVAPFNLRLGLTREVEAGIFVAPYARERETAAGGPAATSAGFGDVTLRGKFNFWGDDGGKTAGGLIVDVTLPTAARGLGSGHAGGTVILPLAFELGGGWDGGAMTAVELGHRDSGGERAVWINAATFGHDLGGGVSGYVEVTSAAGDGGHVATLDAGLTWKLDANTQLDGGVNFGLTRAADDVLVFTGVSRRF